MTLVVAIGATIIEGATLGAVTSAAVTGSTIGSIGAGVIGGATLGSGLGAVKSAIAGEDVGKGALMGAATGAVGGGLAPGVGAAGAAAGEAGSVANIAAQTAAGAGAGALANTAGAAVGGKPIGTAALIGGVTGGALAGIGAANAGPSTPAMGGGQQINAPVSTDAVNAAAKSLESDPIYGDFAKASPSVTQAQYSPTTDTSSGLMAKIGATSGTQALQNVGILGAGAMAENALNQKPEEAANVTPGLAPGLPAAMKAKNVYASSGPFGGLGSIGMARGGQVPVRDGAYIIPADVVSALGNGSSKAGAEFLRRLMEEVKSQGVKRHGLGAVKRAIA